MCLQAMFSLCMVESEADEVTLQGVTSVGLKHALDFAYTGQVSLERRPRHKTPLLRSSLADWQRGLESPDVHPHLRRFKPRGPTELSAAACSESRRSSCQ